MPTTSHIPPSGPARRPRGLLWGIPLALLVLGGLLFFGRGPLPLVGSTDTRTASLAQPSEGDGRTQARALLEQLQSEADPRTRRQLIDALAGLPGGLELLQQAWTQVNDGGAREQILIAASGLGSAPAARWLAELVTTDEKYGPRASKALGDMTGKEAAPALVELVNGRSHNLVRANAARALGSCGGPADAPVLASLVQKPQESLRVRQEAALALGAIGEPTATVALVDTLRSAQDMPGMNGEQLRISLIRGLAALGTPEARAALEHCATWTLSATEKAFLNQALASLTPRS